MVTFNSFQFGLHDFCDFSKQKPFMVTSIPYKSVAFSRSLALSLHPMHLKCIFSANVHIKLFALVSLFKYLFYRFFHVKRKQMRKPHSAVVAVWRAYKYNLFVSTFALLKCANEGNHTTTARNPATLNGIVYSGNRHMQMWNAIQRRVIQYCIPDCKYNFFVAIS